MKQGAFRLKKDKHHTVKKSLSPATGTSGHEYVLYHVNQLHNISVFARLICDLPGEFCCFLRFTQQSENFSKKFSKRRRLAGSRGCLWIDSSGKGKYHLIPQKKGGEK